MKAKGMTQEERDALDTRVSMIVACAGPISSYATACQIERERCSAGLPPIDHEVVNRSLQRLRKRGTIEAKRHGSQSRWHYIEQYPGVSPTNTDYARAVESHGALDVGITISKVISLIDVSKTARSASGDEMGDAYLNDVRTMLLGLIGIEVKS